MSAPADTYAKWTAHRMRRALYVHFIDAWAPLFEITSDAHPDGGTVRRIDMLAVRRARKDGIGPLDLLAVEIKVSRSDFLTDVRDPAKQARWREVAHRHAYAAPAGLIRKDEIPEGSGLLEVSEGANRYCRDRVAWVKQVPYSSTPDVPAWLTLAVSYRLARAEALTRGLVGDTTDGDVEALRAEVKRLRRELENEGSRGDRLDQQLQVWKRAYATGNPVPCATCGEPISPDWSARRGVTWRHRARAATESCEKQRIAALPEYEQERIERTRAQHGAQFMFGVPPIEPADEDFGGAA